MTNQPDESETEAEEREKAPLLIKTLSALTLDKQQPRGACYVKPAARCCVFMSNWEEDRMREDQEGGRVKRARE